MSAKLRVYLETSYVGYLFGKETTDEKIARDQAVTRKWQADESEHCEVFISQFTLDESLRGNTEKVAQRAEFLDKISLLDVDMIAVRNLASELILGHALPEKEVTDALHIATAAVAGMDVLLTWNCRHMANPRTLPITRDIVTKAGFVCPAVMTPKTYLDNLNLED